MKKEISIWEANPKNIWNYRQNHPELVCKDINQAVFLEDFTEMKDKIIKLVRQSMLCRGVNKWLKVRRDFVAYKKIIRNEIKELNKEIPKLKAEMSSTFVEFKKATPHEVYLHFKARENYIVKKEIMKYKERTRRDLKKMCMTPRWQLWEGKKLKEMNTIFASD